MNTYHCILKSHNEYNDFDLTVNANSFDEAVKQLSAIAQVEEDIIAANTIQEEESEE